MTDWVLYEDNHIIIVNKICGDIVQGDKTGDNTLADKVKKYLKEKYNKPGNVFLGISHRLDRPVSGIVIFAKTSKALSRLNKMFKENKITKIYYAVCSEMPAHEQDKLEHYLYRNRKQNKSYVKANLGKETKLAELDYKIIGRSKSFYLLEIRLVTGRHHQIRAQLSHIGCPVKGDLKYNYPRSNPNGGINLHARKIEFEHPVSKQNIVVEATLPDEKIWNLFKLT